MEQGEHDGVRPEAEPEHRHRKQRDGRQRIEHRGQGAEQIAAEAGRDRQRGEHGGDGDPDDVSGKEDLDRVPDLVDQILARDRGEQRRAGVGERGEQVLGNAAELRVQLPDNHQGHEDGELANRVEVREALPRREPAGDVTGLGGAEPRRLELVAQMDRGRALSHASPPGEPLRHAHGCSAHAQACGAASSSRMRSANSMSWMRCCSDEN